jgi:hypothetical protein
VSASCRAVVHSKSGTRRCDAPAVATVRQPGAGGVEHAACARHLDLALGAGWSGKPYVEAQP